jgi:L-alanine-DL-glutamate epimerase-like enolase superfamily enzyme
MIAPTRIAASMVIGEANHADDAARIEALPAGMGPRARLAVCANGRFNLETTTGYAGMLCACLCSGPTRLVAR